MLNIQRFVCNDIRENCYVVNDDTKECVIIDCGEQYPEERTAISDYIRKEQLTPKYLIVTHGHLDHNMGNKFIYDSYQLKPEVSGGDETLMLHLDEQAKNWQMDIPNDFPPVDHFFKAGEKVAFGDHEFQIIPTPGHSHGSVCFYCPEEHVLFSGDTLFKGSIGRTDFPEGSMFLIIQSLRQLTQLPDETTILPGHGPQTLLGDELATNPYLDR